MMDADDAFAADAVDAEDVTCAANIFAAYALKASEACFAVARAASVMSGARRSHDDADARVCR